MYHSSLSDRGWSATDHSSLFRVARAGQDGLHRPEPHLPGVAAATEEAASHQHGHGEVLLRGQDHETGPGGGQGILHFQVQRVSVGEEREGGGGWVLKGRSA